jgi:hypothetical protein
MPDRSPDRGLTINWYKRWHAEELDRLRELGPELKGALDGLRDIYCSRAGSLPNDDKYLAGNLGLSPQKWRPLKQTLIRRGLIWIVGSALECPIAQEAYAEAAMRIHKSSYAGKISAARRIAGGGSNTIERASNYPNPEREGSESNNYNNLSLATVEAVSQPKREENRKREQCSGTAVSVTEALAKSNDPIVQGILDRGKRGRPRTH